MYVCMPASMCSYCSRSLSMLMADSLEKNIWMMKSAVPRSMGTNGLVGSALLISATSISRPTCTTFNGDLEQQGIVTYKHSLLTINLRIPDLVRDIADEYLLQAKKICFNRRRFIFVTANMWRMRPGTTVFGEFEDSSAQIFLNGRRDFLTDEGHMHSVYDSDVNQQAPLRSTLPR